MKKLISVIAACIGALVLAAGIALPSAAADPTDAPSPNPTVANQPPGDPRLGLEQDHTLYDSIINGQDSYAPLPGGHPFDESGQH